MNGRILELAKNPELFQIKDLELLNGEINRHPYIQSLRALHLLGTHRLNPENYAHELSITAAYTTDKKILYQLINSVEETKTLPKVIEEKIAEKEILLQKPINKFTEIESKEVETPQPVFVNGELNRVLFEGEEDFLEREIETIDLESTIESGQIVTQKADNPVVSAENGAFVEAKDAETFSKEIIVEEETISEEGALIEDSSTLSFHATAEFLPDVKIASNPKKEDFKEIEKPALNKHEAEMQRLIAEVEAKMKTSKTQKKSSAEKEEIPTSAGVNFSETQSFDVVKTEDIKLEIAEIKEVAEKEFIADKQKKSEPKPQEISQESIEIKAEPVHENKPEWKPMSFSSNTPDALISKKTEEVSIKKQEVETPKISINKEDEKESAKEKILAAERPVFNVSFFTQNVSALEKENTQEEIQPLVEKEKTIDIPEDSNVPNFINTWQSWLKIDRTKEAAREKVEISITEIKNKVIENFIEKEPRISKLKEESDFVIKERNDDISHLMTETLANLYIEQKLYAKAIKAFGVLSEKHPDKKSHFEDKINQIKELRQNK